MKTMKTYSEIADLRYKVQNPILREQANRYGIITAVRDLRITLLSGLMKLRPTATPAPSSTPG